MRPRDHLPLTSTPLQPIPPRPAATTACTGDTSTVMWNKRFAATHRHRETDFEELHREGLGHSIGSEMSVATLNDSKMFNARWARAGCGTPSATKTSGCRMAMTKLAMRQPPAAAHVGLHRGCPGRGVAPDQHHVFAGADRARQDQPHVARLEHGVRHLESRAAMLESSINPTDFSAIKLFLQNNVFLVHFAHQLRQIGACKIAPRAFGAGSPMIC